MYVDMTVPQSYSLFKSLLFYTGFVQKQQRVALAGHSGRVGAWSGLE